MNTKLNGSKLTLAGRKFSEAWTSCLLCMVQGDLSVISLSHIITAGKTGLLTAMSVLLLSYSKHFSYSTYTLAWLTGVLTMLADMIIHPPHYIAESVITGVGAGVLAILLDKLLKK